MAIFALAPLRATAQHIASINAFTEPSGIAIAEGEWQADTTPFMEWVLNGGAPAMAGFSWAVDASPDCVIDTTATSLQLVTLGDGQHSFQVRAIDTDTVCYSSVSFDLRVDATGEAIASITAFAESGGAPIAEGVFQSDPDPFMEWTVDAGVTPNAGSSWTVDAPPDCVIDTAATSVQLATLNDGQHSFQVRAIDSAGNCGPVGVFDLAIQTASRPIPALGPWALGTLATALVFSVSLAAKRGRQRGQTASFAAVVKQRQNLARSMLGYRGARRRQRGGSIRGR